MNELTTQQWAAFEGELKMALFSAIGAGDAIRAYRALPSAQGGGAAIGATEQYQYLLVSLAERFEALIRAGEPVGPALEALRSEGFADRLCTQMFPGARS